MPELPEVETIRLGLAKKLTGLKIKKVEISSAKSFYGEVEKVKGQKVLKLWRRAKILGIDLTGDISLLIHLKMSGQLIYQGKSKFIGGHPTSDMMKKMPNASTRVIFTFNDNSRLFFNDQRKFGWIKLGDLKSEFRNLISGLGPEPLDKSFTWQVLKERLSIRSKTPVKVAIMDQQLVAGIGNIYGVESCFLAKIDPQRLVVDLTDDDYKRLHLAIIKSLKLAIKKGGSTLRHFVTEEGKKGGFLDYALVYGREGLPCKICGTILKKLVLGGRGTVYCPKCQN